MTALVTQVAGPVPVSEETARATLEPITEPDITAEAPHAPDYNEFINDPTIFPGIAPHQAESTTTAPERYVPWHAPKASTLFNAPIDAQVSSSGRAAALELSGVWGHGTMFREEGIEPVIRDGAAYGEDYFEALHAGVQQTTGDYMSEASGGGTIVDNEWKAVAQANAVANSRLASRSTLFDTFLAAGAM